MVARNVTQTSVWPKPPPNGPPTGRRPIALEDPTLEASHSWSFTIPTRLFAPVVLPPRRPLFLTLPAFTNSRLLLYLHHVASRRAGWAGHGPVPKVGRTSIPAWYIPRIHPKRLNPTSPSRSSRNSPAAFVGEGPPLRADGGPWHASSTATVGAPSSARRDCRSWHKETVVKR